jgi:hypothetical protein
MILDIPSQFQKLFPDYWGLEDLSKKQMLMQVRDDIGAEVERSRTDEVDPSQSKFPDHTYDMNRLYALRELRDAIIAEIGAEA